VWEAARQREPVPGYEHRRVDGEGVLVAAAELEAQVPRAIVVPQGERSLVVRGVQRKRAEPAGDLRELRVAYPGVRAQDGEVISDQVVQRDVRTVQVDRLIDVLVRERYVCIVRERMVRHHRSERDARHVTHQGL